MTLPNPMKASSLLILSLLAIPALSSCRAYQTGQSRSYQIEHGPEELIPVGPPREYWRYGIKPDGSGYSAKEPFVSSPDAYPVARRTNRVGYVENPYVEGALVNVSGFESGQLVKDPETGGVFRVP